MAIFGLWGVGGFGRETMPLLREWIVHSQQGPGEAVFVVDDGYEAESVVNGVRVLQAADFLQTPGERFFNVAIAEPKARSQIAARAIQAGAKPLGIRASTVRVLDDNKIGEAAILCDHVTVTSNARIGRFFHANLYSYVAHDCVIGDFVTFAPQVACNGGVVVEDYAYIGTGAVIRHSTPDRPIRIGKGAVVGMGAVVVESVPPGTTVVGNPARPR